MKSSSWITVLVGLSFALLAMAMSTTAWAVITIGPQPAGYTPGSTSRVPIVLELGSLQADRMAFSLEIQPSAGAPAPTTNLGFEAADVPAPGMLNVTPTFISAAWLTAVSPPRTGRVTLGYVLVAIPGTATISDTYTVHMLNGGASYLGDELLPRVLGADVILGAPAGPPIITISITLTQLGVEVFPTNWNLGTLGPGATKSSWISGQPGAFTATNIGNVEENFTISASVSSPSGWTPGPAPGADTFVICYGLNSDPYTAEPSWSCFGESPVTLAGPIASGAELPFDLRFTAPTSSTTGRENESFVISLAAVAP